MTGKDVVSNDDHSIGKVIAERDDCVIVETGHLRKTKRAIPRELLHDAGDVVRTTVAKEVVDGSPEADLDHFDAEAVRLYYGLDGPFSVDPDELENAEAEALRHGVKPAPVERLEVIEGQEDPAYARPAVYERQASAVDPGGVTANLDDKKHAP